MPLKPPPASKWPVTHAEKIDYLTGILNHPNVQHNVGNIKAAIQWHREFSSDEFCGRELVYFQNGEKVDNWDPNVPGFWVEVSCSWSITMLVFIFNTSRA